MSEFIFTFIAFALVIAGMAVGVLFSNKPIKGSCGGMGALGMDTACDICGGNPAQCEEETRAGFSGESGTFYDASADTAKPSTSMNNGSPNSASHQL